MTTEELAAGSDRFLPLWFGVDLRELYFLRGGLTRSSYPQQKLRRYLCAHVYLDSPAPPAAYLQVSDSAGGPAPPTSARFASAKVQTWGRAALTTTVHPLARPRVRDVRDDVGTNRAAVVDELEAEISEIVEDLPGLVADEPGLGALSLAQILLSWSHTGWIHSEAAFGMLPITTPVPVLSGPTDRFRLNRLGDRQLNRALHIVTTGWSGAGCRRVCWDQPVPRADRGPSRPRCRGGPGAGGDRDRSGSLGAGAGRDRLHRVGIQQVPGVALPGPPCRVGA